MVEDNCLCARDTEASVQIPHHLIQSAEAMTSRIMDLDDVLAGMVELHRLGDEADLAILALLHVRSVRLLHLSWEMLLLLADGEGFNIFEVFEEIEAEDAAFLLVTALFGNPFEENCDCGCCDEDEDDLVVRPIR